MAALGQLETDWRASIKATVLLGSDKFIQKMLEILKGNRREQTGLRLERTIELGLVKNYERDQRDLGGRLGDFNSSTRQRGPGGSFLSGAEIRRITIERNRGTRRRSGISRRPRQSQDFRSD
jgi:hypothetical protein